MKNGQKVAKASDWWSKRRPEIVGDFDIVTNTLSGDVDNSIDPDIEVKVGLTW